MLPVKVTDTIPTGAFPQQSDSYSRGLESMKTGPPLKPTSVLWFPSTFPTHLGNTLQIKHKPRQGYNLANRRRMRESAQTTEGNLGGPQNLCSAKSGNCKSKRQCRRMSHTCPVQVQYRMSHACPVQTQYQHKHRKYKSIQFNWSSPFSVHKRRLSREHKHLN